jgi:hypothetical protein
MFKWSKFRAILLAVGVGVAFHIGGCGISLDRVMSLVAIGSIFD